MPIRLENEHIRLTIELPGEGYQSSRFDHSGKIVGCSFHGIELAGQEMPPEKMLVQSGYGFMNEFGMSSPLGYEQSQPGERFHKIGVGVLQRDDEAYDFLKPYLVQALTFDAIETPHAITFRCASPLINGYAYELEKRVELLEDGFFISYLLQNTGEHPIVTQEYNHNFLSIGGKSTDSNYLLELPENISTAAFEELVDKESLLQIEGNTLSIKQKAQLPFFIKPLLHAPTNCNSWKLTHRSLGLAIQETVTGPAASINLWGWGHVLSPEIFVDLYILAGQSQRWTRKYVVTDCNYSP